MWQIKFIKQVSLVTLLVGEAWSAVQFIIYTKVKSVFEFKIISILTWILWKFSALKSSQWKCLDVKVTIDDYLKNGIIATDYSKKWF